MNRLAESVGDEENGARLNNGRIPQSQAPHTQHPLHTTEWVRSEALEA
jgi:hypothetical protein